METKIKNNGKLIYKIITTITLFVPLPLYLFLSATLLNIKPDYIIYTKIENVEVLEYEDKFFLTTTDNAKMDGVVEFRDGKYGILIDEDDIIKINKKYYSYTFKDGETQRTLIDIKKFELQKQQSYKIPITFFISLFGVLIVVLIVQGKMQFHKKYPHIAVLVALLTGTVILFILNAVIGNILGVFTVSTVSWGLYCLEYYFQKGKIDEKEKETKESELVRLLKEMTK